MKELIIGAAIVVCGGVSMAIVSTWRRLHRCPHSRCTRARRQSVDKAAWIPCLYCEDCKQYLETK